MIFFMFYKNMPPAVTEVYVNDSRCMSPLKMMTNTRAVACGQGRVQNNILFYFVRFFVWSKIFAGCFCSQVKYPVCKTV